MSHSCHRRYQFRRRVDTSRRQLGKDDRRIKGSRTRIPLPLKGVRCRGRKPRAWGVISSGRQEVRRTNSMQIHGLRLSRGTAEKFDSLLCRKAESSIGTASSGDRKGSRTVAKPALSRNRHSPSRSLFRQHSKISIGFLDSSVLLAPSRIWSSLPSVSSLMTSGTKPEFRT